MGKAYSIEDQIKKLSARTKFRTILADPPWRFKSRYGLYAPESRIRYRYRTMPIKEICALPVRDLAAESCHIYLWVVNSMLQEGLDCMEAWGFTYKTNLIWHKIRKDGAPDGSGVGFYFRHTTEIILFGTKGSAPTLKPARSQVNIIKSRRSEHSRKPDEQYRIIESCSPGPYLELFARGTRPGWSALGDQAEKYESRKMLK